MLHFLRSRPVQYLLIAVAGGLLFFPNLGSHSLWDVDEAHNAECAREMLDADNWVVPTFNFVLRTDKPALLYWLMIFAYKTFGVTEFAARLTSAVCGLGSMFLTYELGRRMFSPGTGLLAAVVLGSTFMFCISSHAATPDALLIFCTLLTFFVFWRSYEHGGRGWLLSVGATMALAVLAKGLVGLVLPVAIMGLFLLWERRLWLLLNWRLLGGLVIFALIAVPWYAFVTHDTKWEFARGFFLKHHVERFQAPMEGHSGFVMYHPLVFLVTFAPWSAFLGLTVWYALGKRARADQQGTKAIRSGDPEPFVRTVSPYRFLWCWFGVWMLFFSFAGTKLPNYVLPAFPAFALLTARFLVRWATGDIRLHWAWPAASFGIVGLVGVALSTGLLLASGIVDLPTLKGRTLPELAPLALVGVTLVLAAGGAFLGLRHARRGMALMMIAISSVASVGLLAGLGPVLVDARKAPRPLVDDLAGAQQERDIQIGCFDYYQPSLVWYTRRQVVRFSHATKAVDLLHSPKQSYLVLSAEQWEQLRRKVDGPTRVVGRHWDLMAGKEIVVVTNRAEGENSPTPSGSLTRAR